MGPFETNNPLHKNLSYFVQFLVSQKEICEQILNLERVLNFDINLFAYCVKKSLEDKYGFTYKNFPELILKLEKCKPYLIFMLLKRVLDTSIRNMFFSTKYKFKNGVVKKNSIFSLHFNNTEQMKDLQECFNDSIYTDCKRNEAENMILNDNSLCLLEGPDKFLAVSVEKGEFNLNQTIKFGPGPDDEYFSIFCVSGDGTGNFYKIEDQWMRFKDGKFDKINDKKEIVEVPFFILRRRE